MALRPTRRFHTHSQDDFCLTIFNRGNITIQITEIKNPFFFFQLIPISDQSNFSWFQVGHNTCKSFLGINAKLIRKFLGKSYTPLYRTICFERGQAPRVTHESKPNESRNNQKRGYDFVNEHPPPGYLFKQEP